MNDPLITLARIDEALEGWDERNDYARYAALKVMLADLQKHARENELTGYGHEKLAALIWHVDAMFGADAGNGHSFERHAVWAVAALEGLRSEHGFAAGR
jgi:hypothetical protein